ncbi:MAG: hypothetical protein WC760_06420 [Bacteroidia bacterium]|jgi:hypothetical protein
MQISQEQLQEIENFASRGFLIKEIAAILGVDEPRFERIFSMDSHPAVQAFQRGTLKAQLTIRNSIFDSAVSGSGPAQTEMLKIFSKQVQYLKQIRPDA